MSCPYYHIETRIIDLKKFTWYYAKFTEHILTVSLPIKWFIPNIDFWPAQCKKYHQCNTDSVEGCTALYTAYTVYTVIRTAFHCLNSSMYMSIYVVREGYWKLLISFWAKFWVSGLFAWMFFVLYYNKIFVCSYVCMFVGFFVYHKKGCRQPKCD